VSRIVHRDLTDMCCAVKDMQVIPGIESVSKTKIRGLFSLLKACGALGMVSEEGESVQLVLGEGIHSFKDLKQRHDLFMNQVLNHLRVSLPIEFEAQLLWNWNDSEYVNKKVVEMKELEEIVVHFFLHGKQVSSTTANEFLTTVSLQNYEEDDENDYYFDNEFESKVSFQQGLFPEKQQPQPQFSRPTVPPSRNQQTFPYERIERNFSSTGNSNSLQQSSYQPERPQQQQPARGSPQLVSYGLHQRNYNYLQQSQLSQPPQPPQLHPQGNNTNSNIHSINNNINNNTNQDSSSIHIFNNSFSSDSLQSRHYWNESQQILRHRKQFSRGSSSNNNNNNNNLSRANINNNTANQSFSNVMNSYNKQY
jgi:hypothetical protein